MLHRLHTLVVDDDLLARSRLRALLRADPDVGTISECASGHEAVLQIPQARPDLLFLDVQMPGLDGFGVVEAVGAEQMPVVVFVSAHVGGTVRALNAYGLDCLLKPFDDAGFARVLARAKEQCRTRPPGRDVRIDALTEFLRQPVPPVYPSVVAVTRDGQYHLLRVEGIDWLEATDDSVVVHAQESFRLLNRTLAELEKRVLDPVRFVRIHRSVIVNLARVVAVQPLPDGEYDVVLATGVHLTCSRRYREHLQERAFVAR